MLTLTALRRRLRSDDGFVMPIMMATIVVVLIVVAGVLADVQNDFGPSRKDENRKMAYAAAEAGVADYLAHLENNPSYWSKCTDPGNNPSLGNPGTKNFVNVPGSSEQYAIELLPTAGYAQCIVGTDDSFVSASGEFKIRATGRADANDTSTRQIVATFRPKGFLNYIYYTDVEAKDPLLYAFDTDGRATRSASQDDVITWADRECMTTYWPARGSLLWSGEIQRADGTWQGMNLRCSEISFGGGDRVAGPMHTNDQVHLCGTAYFGRRPTDAIEVGGSPGWTNICTSEPPYANIPGSGTVNGTRGTWTIASQRDFPPSNAGLHDDALTQYRFKGPTHITLNGSQMHVTGKREDGTAVDQDMAIPEGVVYVSDDAAAGSCPGLQPLAPYNGSSSGAPDGNPACGDLFLQGTYAQNVTFASGNDIVVTDDITRASDAWMLGIIPDKWARVYHPVNRIGSFCTDAPSGRITNVQIDAAILALSHSFTVDAYECGAGLGTLTIRGAIAQKHRGPVGTSGGNTGFIKNYQYDQRLAQRSPPRFMNPVQPAWAVADTTEQTPTS
jgi:Tfp pilus assembly protein PilX